MVNFAAIPLDYYVIFSLCDAELSMITQFDAMRIVCIMILMAPRSALCYRKGDRGLADVGETMGMDA